MKNLIIGMLSTLFFVIVGCSSNLDSSPDYEKNKRPGYVTMNTDILNSTNNIMWEVHCGDFKVSVADRNFEEFYKEDGTQMTMREYCDFARDRIRRRK
ncbi:MAG: hypothetical protein K6L75_08990 [Cellvibrionaceae bacterium]